MYREQLAVILCFTVRSVFALSQRNADPIDVTVVRDVTPGNMTRTTGLPETMQLHLNLHNTPVDLYLERNGQVNEHADVFVIRKGTDGKDELVQQTLNTNKRSGVYQDHVNGGTFTITCSNGTSQSCSPSVVGSFHVGGVEYDMEPSSSAHEAMARKKRSIVDEKEKFYSIYRSNRAVPSTHDFQDTPDVSNKSPNVRMKRELNQHFARNKRQVPGKQMYGIELLVVTDYAIYKWWYDQSSGSTSYEKDLEAKGRIREYFAHVVNGIDMRYSSIDDPRFGIFVVLSGYVIADRPESSPWTTSRRKQSVVRDQVSAKDALDALADWRMDVRNMRAHDHIMLFTGYDIYSGTSDNSTAGYGYVRSLCRFDSASINEDHGGFSGITTATHELGHGIGARHDGDRNGCTSSDQYIMTAFGGRTNEFTKLNPWKFSPCSIDAFYDFFTNYLPPQNCLTDRAVRYNTEEWNLHMRSLPGQLYGTNEQCQQLLGPGSYYGWGGSLGEYSTACTEMFCSMPKEPNRYRVYQAARGTSCGDKKWCIEGQCAYDDQAPNRNGECVHGDSLTVFSNGMTCPEYIKLQPRRCYYSYYKKQCCDSCHQMNRAVYGCEYGDKSGQCEQISRRHAPWLCYANGDLCCGTCAQMHTGVKGCEYGDKQSNCDIRYCNTPGNEQYTLACCGTCGGMPRIPRVSPTYVKPTTTAATTTTRRTTTPRPTTTKPTTTKPTTTTTSTPRPTTTVKEPTTARKVIFVNLGSKTTTKPTPTPETELCVKPDASFMGFVSCAYLRDNIVGQTVCNMNAFRATCCEKCQSAFTIATSTELTTTSACQDDPTCDVTSGADCYSTTRRAKCPCKCKSFETGNIGCQYGDRLGDSSCQRYIRTLTKSYVCTKYLAYCCQSCRGTPHNIGVKGNEVSGWRKPSVEKQLDISMNKPLRSVEASNS